MMPNPERIYKAIMSGFECFLNAPGLYNTYIYSGNTKVYVRKGIHPIDGKLVDCLDIANIDIAVRARNKGLGMRLIANMHEASPYKVTIVESILNDNLYDALKRRGWEDVPDTGARSLMKRKDNGRSDCSSHNLGQVHNE